MSLDPAPKTVGKGPWSIPSWRRIGNFFVTLAQLERSYQTLKSENTKLRDEVERLGRIVEDHGGQLKVLTMFVQSALQERTDMRVEKAVAREIERLTRRRSPQPDGDS